MAPFSVQLIVFEVSVQINVHIHVRCGISHVNVILHVHVHLLSYRVVILSSRSCAPGSITSVKVGFTWLNKERTDSVRTTPTVKQWFGFGIWISILSRYYKFTSITGSGFILSQCNNLLCTLEFEIHVVWVLPLRPCLIDTTSVVTCRQCAVGTAIIYKLSAIYGIYIYGIFGTPF